MPLYEYRCGSCGTVSEYLVGVGREQPSLACDACGSEQLEQMISLVSVSKGAAPEGCCGGAEDCEGAGCGPGGSCACGY